MLYITPVFWIFWGFTRLLATAFFNLTICIIGTILSGSNVIGYYKCAKGKSALHTLDHQKRAKKFLQKQAGMRIMGFLPGMS